jgi:hypothetical protein
MRGHLSGWSGNIDTYLVSQYHVNHAKYQRINQAAVIVMWIGSNKFRM